MSRHIITEIFSLDVSVAFVTQVNTPDDSIDIIVKH